LSRETILEFPMSLNHLDSAMKVPRILSVTRPVRIAPAGAYLLLAATAPHRPSMADLQAPGRVFAWLSHDAGLAWPNRRGELLMDAVLAQGGTVALVFEAAADALACRERLIAGDRP
jgi:hypothetical protein